MLNDKNSVKKFFTYKQIIKTAKYALLLKRDIESLGILIKFVTAVSFKSSCYLVSPLPPLSGFHCHRKPPEI